MEGAVCGLSGIVMYAPGLRMEAFPSIHLPGAFTIVLTAVFRLCDAVDSFPALELVFERGPRCCIACAWARMCGAYSCRACAAYPRRYRCSRPVFDFVRGVSKPCTVS